MVIFEFLVRQPLAHTRFFVFALVVFFAFSLSHGRNLSSIRKDAFTVGVSKSDSVAEYDFISEITSKMKISRFRIVVFENANAGQKLLLDGKIDAIISGINYSPQLESRFLVSAPYGKADIAVAMLYSSNEILTLADLNGKVLAFVPKDISYEQVNGIWKNSKLHAVQNLNDAIDVLSKGEADAIIADRKTLELQKDFQLRIFPNKLLENNTVALFAPGSKGLQEEFNNVLKIRGLKTESKETEKFSSSENSALNKERIAKIISVLDELKKELQAIQKELK